MTNVKNVMKKMLIIGDAAVGKTSLVRRFVYERFDDKYLTTIGTKTSAKSLQFNHGEDMINLKLQIWDILGQKGYTKLHNSSFKGTNGVFLVADITRKETLASIITYWIPKVKYLVGEVPMVILANKSDLIKDAQFTKNELTNLASKFNASCYLTSAKNGSNVDSAFHVLGKQMIEIKEEGTKKLQKTWVIHPRLLFEGDKSEISKVIDKIIDDFCKDYANLEDAMPVIKRQFELAELDLNHPTIEALTRAIDRLEKVEMHSKKRKIARADHDKRLKWIEEIKLKE
jgi:small GTP-binding protein